MHEFKVKKTWIDKEHTLTVLGIQPMLLNTPKYEIFRRNKRTWYRLFSFYEFVGTFETDPKTYLSNIKKTNY